jgi:c-di-GMP-binding flagellar brake protein YcgR
MTEQRGEKRRKLHSYLQAFDGVSSRIVGHVVDLTRTGMMLVCKEPVGVQEEFRLRITFPNPISDHVEFNVQAVCRWCREDVHSDNYVAGFQFQDLSPEKNHFVSRLINNFGFQD